MLKDSENNIIIASLISITFLITLFLPFSIYGQDGYTLWYPLISEYMQGDKVYHSSSVIFNGQNLSAIYGELPFWKIFRLLGIQNPAFLNLTHFVFVSALFAAFLTIHKGLKGKTNKFDVAMCFLFAAFGPIILNRTMAGHLNLLFGILPFFACLALIFEQDLKTSVLCFFSFWFALSTCDYQLLSYYIFYLPLLTYIFLNYSSKKKKVFIILISTFLLAFAINWPQFIEMFTHAMSENNSRTLNENVVYSYLTSHPYDLLEFIFSGKNSIYNSRSQNYYHEINYGMGLLFFFFLIKEKDWKLKAVFITTFSILFLFCMNAPLFNLISELPVLKAFRVPQRSFMVLAAFLPIWTYSRSSFEFERKHWWILGALLISAQIIPSYEVIALIMVAILVLSLQKKEAEEQTHFKKSVLFLICISSLFVGVGTKILPNRFQQKHFEFTSSILKPLHEQFSKEELRKKTFHFESMLGMSLYIVAQTEGVRTVEGYGHPPKDLVYLLSQFTGGVPDYRSNTFFLPFASPRKQEILKAFGINYIVTVDNQLVLRVTKIND